jgi:retron-type reverse transcriptase
VTKAFEISKKLIWEAYQRVKSNGGAAGVDQESIEKFESDLSNNLYKLWNRNPTRRHSTVGYVSPIDFEKAQKA